jgi:hypothetical protein
MAEIQKDIDIIYEVLNNYYTEKEFIYNPEAQLFMCPVCCIEYVENEWIYSVVHSNMINSVCIEEAVIISMDIIKNGIDLKLSSGQFFIFNEDNIIEEIIFADDVWGYMAQYDVSEEFAVNVLTSRVLESKFKKELN